MFKFIRYLLAKLSKRNSVTVLETKEEIFSKLGHEDRLRILTNQKDRWNNMAKESQEIKNKCVKLGISQ